MSYTALAFSELTFEIGKSLLATCSSLFAETRQFLCLEWVEADKQRWVRSALVQVQGWRIDACKNLWEVVWSPSGSSAMFILLMFSFKFSPDDKSQGQERVLQCASEQHGTGWRGKLPFLWQWSHAYLAGKKRVTLSVGRCLESACRYSGHYSAQGNLRGCKNCIPWESAIGYRFLKWKKGCRGAVWWAAMREKGARRKTNACVQKSGQKQG